MFVKPALHFDACVLQKHTVLRYRLSANFATSDPADLGRGEKNWARAMDISTCKFHHVLHYGYQIGFPNVGAFLSAKQWLYSSMVI